LTTSAAETVLKWPSS